MTYYTERGSLFFDGSIKGQKILALYDPIRQAALMPDLRRKADGKIVATLPYEDMGIEGMLSELTAIFNAGNDRRTVRANQFYWAEYLMNDTFSFSVLKNGQAPANSVTATISRLSQTLNGAFVKPQAGFRAIIKENNFQVVRITNVTKISNGNFSVSLQGINGQTVDLNSRSQYTITIMPMRDWDTTTNQTPVGGFVYNPPMLRKSYIAKYELGIQLSQDEIDGFVNSDDFMLVAGVGMNGEEIEYYYIPAINDKFRQFVAANRTLNLLFGRRDYVTNQGFDGIIPTIQDNGLFNTVYDDLLKGSFKSLLFSMIRSLRRVNGSEENFLLHDFNFGIDWAEAMAAMVNATNQSYKYSLFGDGGVGLRDLAYFQFGTFSYQNYRFIPTQINMFDSYRYGNILEYFAMLMPAKRFRDTQGRIVPIITMCTLQDAERAMEERIIFDDARQRGFKYINAFVYDSLGYEFHAPTMCGLITKAS
jgi:hypothetical protein